MARVARVALVGGALCLTAAVVVTGIVREESASEPPPSDVSPPPDHHIAWMWSGAVTDDGVSVRAGVGDDVRRARLVVSTSRRFTDPVRSGATRPDGGVAALRVTGLEPDTEYHYALALDGQLVTERTGRFRTFPAAGEPASFAFTLGACSRTGSDSAVWNRMAQTRSLFHLVTGDWFYGNLERNDRAQAEAFYTENLTSLAQARFYSSTPIAYVWDDHDSGGNNADRTGRSWPAIHATYRSFVPHYPLHSGPRGPVHQAFTVGDVRFVLTDTRAARDPGEREQRSMLGEDQRRWLLRELARADDYGLVVLMSGVPWVDEAERGGDNWGGYARERRVVADAIARHDIDNLFMVAGDAHMLAYDDGTNTDYSRSGDASFPLFHAAAVDRRGSVKGGPYSGPVLPGTGQFGQVRVRDDGRVVRVTVTGLDWKGRTLLRRTFSVRR